MMLTRAHFVALLTVVIGCGCEHRPTTTFYAAGARTNKLPAPKAAPGDWPWWRGPTLDGKSEDGKVPREWSYNRNVIWQVPVPGRGHSTPSVWGDRVFVSTANEQDGTQSLLSFDRKTGRERWNTRIHEGTFARMHRANSQASATPACDGERVYVPFVIDDALHLTATDLDGKIVWQRSAGAFESEHGYGSSPVLHESTVIVCGDSLEDSFLAAFDRESGEPVWKTTRGDAPNYATPIVANVAGRKQLLICGMLAVESYDPDSGERIWFVKGGPSTIAACTMTFDGDLVFASGGYPEKELLCIKADGTGDVTDSHVVWREKRGTTYVPSPLAHEGKLFVVNDKGIVSCFAQKTGELIWRDRLHGGFSASPTLADGHLFVPNEKGVVYVLEAADEFRLVATNELGDGGFASPVICGAQIFLRTASQLYCIGESGESRESG